jgi:hypothetical protein
MVGQVLLLVELVHQLLLLTDQFADRLIESCDQLAAFIQFDGFLLQLKV